MHSSHVFHSRPKIDRYTARLLSEADIAVIKTLPKPCSQASLVMPITRCINQHHVQTDSPTRLIKHPSLL